MQHGYDCPCPDCAQRRAEWEEDARELSRETERGWWQRQAARVAESEREEEEARRWRRERPLAMTTDGTPGGTTPPKENEMNETTIPAQMLYDLREMYEFATSESLQKFFARETGDPSPSGKWRVDATAAFQFVEASYPAECFASTLTVVVREMWEYLLAEQEWLCACAEHALRAVESQDDAKRLRLALDVARRAIELDATEEEHQRALADAVALREELPDGAKKAAAAVAAALRGETEGVLRAAVWAAALAAMPPGVEAVYGSEAWDGYWRAAGARAAAAEADWQKTTYAATQRAQYARIMLNAAMSGEGVQNGR